MYAIRLFAGVICCVLSAAVAGGAPIELLSGIPAVGPLAAGESFQPMLSADGKRLVFLSTASTLVSNEDRAAFLDVFVRNLETHETQLVSVNRSGHGGGNGPSAFASVSADGRFVAFASEADDLVEGDTNQSSDVFVRDLVTGVTTLASLAVTGRASGRGASTTPQISPDGLWVVFASLASDLVEGDTNELQDVFLRDLQTQTTLRVSAGTFRPTDVPNSLAVASDLPVVNSNGTRIAFRSNAGGLGGRPPNSGGDIFLFDRSTDTTTWASSNLTQSLASPSLPYRCLCPLLSADGRAVAFKVEGVVQAFPNTGTALFHYDLGASQLRLLSAATWPETSPALSGDGRFVAAEHGDDLWRWGARDGTSVRITQGAPNQVWNDRVAHTPVMTPDGNFIAFLSKRTNAAPDTNIIGNGSLQIYVHDVARQTTRLVTFNQAKLPSTLGVGRIVPALRHDGQAVAWESSDPELTPDDPNLTSDIFFRDLATEQTTLVSLQAEGGARQANLPYSRVGPNCISDDGRFVVFTSLEQRGKPGMPRTEVRSFLRDLSQGGVRSIGAVFPTNPVAITSFWAFAPQVSADGSQIVLRQLLMRRDFPVFESVSTVVAHRRTTDAISVISGGGAGVSSLSIPFAGIARIPVSRDGRYVLVDDGLNSASLLWREISSRSNEVVSIDPNGIGRLTSTPGSFYSAISPDSRWALFGVRNDAYARDLLSKRTHRVGAFALQFDSRDYFVFSSNSHFVAFAAPRGVTVHDLEAQTNVALIPNSASPALNRDGSMMALEKWNEADGLRQIMLCNWQTGATNLVSVNRAGTGGDNGHSRAPSLTPDGRKVVFASKASDLVAGDDNGVSDIFLRDLVAGTTTLLSINPRTGRPGNGPSMQPYLSGDGRTIVFQSFASDLVDSDHNGDGDVFAVRLGSGDSDGDGVDDDWEMTYFGNLSRDGTGDFDQDGSTDRQEFVAGTDPINNASVLRTLTLISLDSGQKSVLWSAVPGKRYIVQFKDAVTDTAWRELPGSVTAVGGTASQVDGSAAASPQRFYRVLLAP